MPGSAVNINIRIVAFFYFKKFAFSFLYVFPQKSISTISVYTDFGSIINILAIKCSYAFYSAVISHIIFNFHYSLCLLQINKFNSVYYPIRFAFVVILKHPNKILRHKVRKPFQQAILQSDSVQRFGPYTYYSD